MHELGVTFHIMDHLEKVAKENEVEKIRKVVLELGEVSTVIESYLQNCWTWAAKKRPLFEEAELIVETLPAITYCEECEKTYSTIEYGKIFRVRKRRVSVCFFRFMEKQQDGSCLAGC